LPSAPAHEVVPVAESFDPEDARWPDDAVKTPPPAIAPENKAPLPSLESLLARLPAETRETLDDLFRAKFTGVRHVPGRVLK
jgi:hypothetical protein